MNISVYIYNMKKFFIFLIVIIATFNVYGYVHIPHMLYSHHKHIERQKCTLPDTDKFAYESKSFLHKKTTKYIISYHRCAKFSGEPFWHITESIIDDNGNIICTYRFYSYRKDVREDFLERGYIIQEVNK